MKRQSTVRSRRPHGPGRRAAAWLFVVAVTLLSGAPRAEGAGAPRSPWDLYNEAVQSYGVSRYEAAFEQWQQLALEPLPRGLRAPVWFQLGNVQFRLGEPLEGGAPEQAVEWWHRSLEAYRTALQHQARHSAAQHNRALVERRLARLLQRLGLEALEASGKQPLPAAIDLLRVGTEQLAEAVTLDPDDPAIRRDRDRLETALQQRLSERAAQAETRGDQEAVRNTPWNDNQAEEQYRAALDDLDEAERRPGGANAEPPSPTDARPADATSGPLEAAIRQGQERVQQKLSDLLTRMGRREQQTGSENAKYDTESALEPYAAALDHFGEAQQVQPGNAAARQGEREVRAALEQLHLRLGQRALEDGRERLNRRSPDAAPPLRTALGNFEAAQGLNPENAEARAGAEEARRLLPEALVLEGRRNMESGDRMEAHQSSEALNRYQEAENAFEQALGLQPGQPQAQQGLQEVQPRLARLRERVAREAEQAARQRAQPGREPESLQDLLGQVTERDRDRAREGEWERRRQRGQKQTGPPRNGLDW